jgi:hypothetical protein
VRRRGRRLAAAGLALVVIAVAIVAVAGWPGAGSAQDRRLSDGFRQAALRPCAQFDRELKGHRVSAGDEGWIRMASLFREARTRLTRRLEGLARDPSDRPKLRPLLDRLAEGSELLKRSADRARAGDLDGQIALDKRYDAVFSKQREITVQLGLGGCGK